MDVLAKFQATILAANKTKYDHFQGIAKPAVNKKLNPAAKERPFWKNDKPQLQLQITPKIPDQYAHIQGSTYTKPCTQKSDILAKF